MAQSSFHFYFESTTGTQLKLIANGSQKRHGCLASPLCKRTLAPGNPALGEYGPQPPPSKPSLTISSTGGVSLDSWRRGADTEVELRGTRQDPLPVFSAPARPALEATSLNPGVGEEGLAAKSCSPQAASAPPAPVGLHVCSRMSPQVAEPCPVPSEERLP